MMEETKEEKKLCRNPSGIPPLSCDSDDETDQGDLNASTVLSTVVEHENGAPEANRDPPVAEKVPSGTVEDGDDDDVEDNDVGEAAVDDHGPETSAAITSTSLPTTDEQLPRVEPIKDIPTRGGLPLQNADTGALPVSQNDTTPEQSANSPQGKSPIYIQQMPPNIIRAALQEEVQVEALEMVNDHETTQSEDEKKSEERSDEVLMALPEQRPSGNVYDAPNSTQGPSLSHAHSMPPFPDPYIQQQQMAMPHPPYGYSMAPVPPPYMTTPAGGGRRKIMLRLEEDAPPSHARRPSFFFRHLRDDSIMPTEAEAAIHGVDRGSIAVSWFEGTTSAELQEHVRRSLIRKMGLKGNVKLVDLRIIDETMDPPEGTSSWSIALLLWRTYMLAK